jgi:hypothetical protein
LAIRRLSTTSITSTGGKSSKLWDQETTLGTFESIATATVDASGASSIDFTNIPQTYKHLQIRGIAKFSTASSLAFTFNSDTGNNYAIHHICGNGASASSNNATSLGTIRIQRQEGVSATANIFTGFVLDILDYNNTNKYKTTRSLAGDDKNGSGSISLESGLWMNTSAISSITFTSPSAYTFSQYSSFALYGIRGA